EDGQSLEVRYGLEPLVANPYETVVEGSRETRTEVSRVSLRDAEIREVPGTLGDPFRVVMLLPGVASVGSGLSYPIVRGSQPAATGYFLDGVRVPMLFHTGIGPAVVHPDFIDGVDFFAGAPPTRYGRLMGGVVEGRISHPREDRLHASAYADFINAGGFVEAPIKETGTSITVAGRMSYTGLLIQTVVPLLVPENSPEPISEFWDYQARLEQKLGSAKLRLLAFGSSDLVGTRADKEQSFSTQLAQRFHRADLRLSSPLAGGEGELGFTWGTDQVGIFGQSFDKPAGEFTLNQGSLRTYGKWLRRFSDALELEAGAELQRLEGRSIILDRGNQSTDRPDEASDDLLRRPLSLSVQGGAYAELRWTPSPEWTVAPGLRADTYRLVPGLQWASLEPRLSVRRALGPEWALKAAAGFFHQAPTLQLTLPAVDVAGLQYGLQEGLQFDAGAEWRPEGGMWELTLDGYVNPYLRAVEFSLQDSLESTRRNGILGADPGVRGLSYGAELMLRRKLGAGLFGWVSYSFNQSTRRQRFIRFSEDGLSGTVVNGDVPFAFQQAHVLNAAVSWQLPGSWTLGAAAHFNTGRPMSGEISSREQRLVEINGLEAWAPVDRDRVNDLPPFFRLDARVAKTWTFDDYSLELSFEMLNATISREVYGYNYDVYSPYWSGMERVGETLGREPIAVPVVIPRLGLKGTY
ncbi:MAG: TonB-dependent receptor, partial [Myxococcaceae bacterium]|nr:TonB-dependent receptor [Myxococcaceae bacterium]